MSTSEARALRKLVDQVRPMLARLPVDERAVRTAPGKWSRQEILGHLIDSAANNHHKFVRTMQQPALSFVGYAQDDWVALQRWHEAVWEEMVTLWSAYNRHLAYLMEQVQPDQLAHNITIEGAGPYTLSFIMTDYLEHLKHHLNQIFPDLDLPTSFENVYNA